MYYTCNCSYNHTLQQHGALYLLWSRFTCLAFVLRIFASRRHNKMDYFLISFCPVAFFFIILNIITINIRNISVPGTA